MSEQNELEVLAMAALDIPELARGVIGEVAITGGWGQDEQTAQEALDEIHRAQVTLVEAGWRRDKGKERLAPFSHNIEVAAYRKQFTPGQESRWVTVTIAVRFGIHARFTGGKDCPW